MNKLRLRVCRTWFDFLPKAGMGASTFQKGEAIMRNHVGVQVGAGLGTLLLAFGAMAADSTFHQSCINASLSADGVNLIASCRNSIGRWSTSSLALRGIQVVRGVLTIVPGGVTNYRKSCSEIRLEMPVVKPNPRIVGYCKSEEGIYNSSYVELSGIDNRNGVLTYQ